MSKYYSKTTNGFYDREIHEVMPSDVVEITEEYYQELFTKQTEGFIISSDKNGYPINISAPAPTLDQTLTAISSLLDKSLNDGAKKWGYNNIVSGTSYVNSTNMQYKLDAESLILWRDTVWDWALPLFPKVKAGDSPEKFILNMPKQPEQPKA